MLENGHSVVEDPPLIDTFLLFSRNLVERTIILTTFVKKNQANLINKSRWDFDVRWIIDVR